MRKKLEQFRRQIREEHINSYKESIRESLIETIARDQKIDHLNIRIRSCLDAQDAQELFETFTATDKYILQGMDRQMVFGIYRVFICRLQKYKSSQILRDIVELFASSLFSEASLEITHGVVFERVHSLAHELITKLNKQEKDSSVCNHQLDNYLAILCCFYSSKYHKLLKRQITEKGVQLALNYIIPWGINIASSIIYLKLLSNVILNPLLSDFLKQKPANQFLILRLSVNLASENHKLICWSLITLNDSLQNWNSFTEQCLRQLMPRYLQAISIIYPEVQANISLKQAEFKKQHLLQSLNTLEKLVRIIWQMNYAKVGLGHLMLTYQTFRLFSLANQIEYFPDRCLLYGLLDYTIRVVMDLEDDERAISLIARELQDTLLLGLGNKFSNHITINSLHVIQRLVRYQSQSYNQFLTIQWFREGGILPILEYLQFNKQHEVAAISISLLNKEFCQTAMEITQ